jgi:hypothetical protein
VSEFPLITWVFLGALVTIQATWIFRDACMRGESFAWLWGLFGLINVPSSFIVYILVTRRGNIRCIQCGKSIRRESHVCPYCRKANK